MNEISTTLYKVNWEYLINNCLNQNFWKNNWKVFEVDGITITLSISYIDVSANRIVFKVDGKSWDYENIQIPLDVNHFNKVVFNNSLYNAVKRILEVKEKHLIVKLPEHINAYELDEENNSSHKEEVRQHGLGLLFDGLDEDDLNKSQKEALKRYVYDNHDDTYPLTEVVESRLTHKHRPAWFGLLALTLGTPEQYDKWLEAQPSVGYADVVESIHDHIDLEDMEGEDD